MLAPTVEKLAANYQGKIKVGKMDTDKNMDTPGNLRISSIPTVVIFQNGKEVGRLLGVSPESKYVEALNKIGVD
jgi:thioredoxin 1